MNALVIGCGNIGALYDFQKDAVKTHCKALSLMPSINVSVYDVDSVLAQKIAAEYGFRCIDDKKNIRLKEYDWVAIASPTDTHLYWINECLTAAVPLIICEKPIAKTANELTEIEAMYRKHKSQIVVNYFRRFQPAYIKLREQINAKGVMPVAVVVKYQRGIVNNFSHAADMLSFLFGQNDFESVHVTQRVADEFKDDPTISFTATYKGIPLSVCGIANARYSYFEIGLFFTDHKISIEDSGNRIMYYNAVPAQRFYQPLEMDVAQSCKELLTNQMKYVYQYVQQVSDKVQADNFISSLEMNQHILKIIQY